MTKTVDQWLAYLESIHANEIDLGLARVEQVVASLGCQRPAALTILVAGTNGKGTTSALLAALLRRNGLSVGVYSSPHIQRYNERVSVNGEDISDDELIASFERVEQARGETPLTYFEFGTVAALAHFQHLSAKNELDACVIEVGLGGRLDATNVIEADISVVTSIGLDHQDWLGDSLDDIAFEKCGIARSGRYLVCGQENPPARAQQQTESLGGLWMCRGRQFDIETFDSPQGPGLHVLFQSLSGEREWYLPAAQIPYHNVITAIQTLALINQLPNHEAVSEEIERLTVRGRMQRKTLTTAGGDIELVLDVAHNAQAAAHLKAEMPRVDGVVLAMLADKEPEVVVNALPVASVYYLAGLPGPRGLSAEQLSERVEATVASDATECFADVAQALVQLRARTDIAGQRWLIAGSFLTVEAALNALETE